MSVTPAGGNGTMIFTGLLGYCWAKAEPETTSAAPSAAMRMNLCISAPSGCVLFPLVVLILDLVRSESKLPCYLCLCPRGGNPRTYQKSAVGAFQSASPG